MAGGDRGGEHPHQEQHGQAEEGAQGAAAQDQGGGEQMLKNILIYKARCAFEGAHHEH